MGAARETAPPPTLGELVADVQAKLDLPGGIAAADVVRLEPGHSLGRDVGKPWHLWTTTGARWLYDPRAAGWRPVWSPR